MRRSSEVAAELDLLRTELRPMQRREAQLELELWRCKSKELVAERDIRIVDVVLSNQKYVPFFYVDTAFIDWIKNNGLDAKQWVEWNGVVHPMAEFLSGKLCYDDGIVRIDDVREADRDRR